MDNKNLWPLTLLKLMMVVLTGIVVYTGIEYYKQRELEGVARRAQENQQRLISLEMETFKTTSDIVATLMFDDTTRQLLYDATHGGDEEKIRFWKSGRRSRISSKPINLCTVSRPDATWKITGRSTRSSIVETTLEVSNSPLRSMS
ncbi:hypothetical protein [Hydrogenimonas sp.]